MHVRYLLEDCAQDQSAADHVWRWPVSGNPCSEEARIARRRLEIRRRGPDVGQGVDDGVKVIAPLVGEFNGAVGAGEQRPADMILKQPDLA